MKRLLLITFILISGSFTFDAVVEGGNIQDIINNAKEGDVIYIKEGVYFENLFINKSISLIGLGEVIINGMNRSAVTINANKIRLINISFENSGNEAVVKINGKYNEIIGCKIHNGRIGIESMEENVIKNCEIYRCGAGIVFRNRNLLYSSNISKCGIGIEIYGGKNEIVKCNVHTCGVAIYLENAFQNFINESNIYKNNNNEGGIFLLYSHYNEIYRCNLSYGSFAIRMVESNYNAIRENKIFRSRYGIKMESCIGNEIKKNSIVKNRFGITMENCNDISINYNDIDNYMYNIDAKYSKCDASYNYWGGFIPRKIHRLISYVKFFPWFIYPMFDNVLFPMENRKINEEKTEIKKFRSFLKINCNDFDPLVDIKVGVKIKRIRSIGERRKYELKVFIDGKENNSFFKGDCFPNYTMWQNVDDGKQEIKIEMMVDRDKAYITYDLARGDWYGDDFLGDKDGYGHIKLKKYEIWFDIFYNDYDGDGLTYWEEVNIYNTNPKKSDYGKDYDGDGIPIQWEDKYGFSDFIKENHSIDYDEDGLNNVEEYLFHKFLSDPFAKDIFIEIDYMQGYKLHEESLQLLYDAFTKHNINLHIDLDEEISYKERISYRDARDLYWRYFLHNNTYNKRYGVFHYAIIISSTYSKRGGHVFVGFDNCDALVIAGDYINKWRKGNARKVAYASLLMHELGHTLGLFENTFGGIDNESCNAPWLKGYWIYRNYKSCMNYRYAFSTVDYSDGSHGRNDFNDWGALNLKFFKNSYYYE